ncbi:MAG: hypothetical protein MR902_02620 [Campylobacter sp.]|nr:hypothetical protein [Campylobacter sp.]
MNENLQIALKLESMGNLKEAYEILSKIYELDRENLELKVAYRRLYNRLFCLNRDMLKLFLSNDDYSTDKFKRWLVEL